MERRRGFFQILISAPLGRRHTVNKKILCIALLSFWLTFLVWLPRWWQVLRDYGLPGFFAPSVSIPLFAHFPVWLSLGALLIISMAMSYIAFLCLGLLVSLLAHKVGNPWATILIAGLALGLPPLLAILGVDVAKWVGLWPSLNVVSIWMQHGSAAMITIFLACTAVGLFSGLALRRCYALR